MDDKIQNFKDMVEATERMSKPWQRALIVTNICWAVVFILFLIFAYVSPTEMAQGQDFNEQTQSQTYSEGVTHSE